MAPPSLYTILERAAGVRVDPGAADHEDWVELSRWLVAVGRDQGGRLRQTLEDHWEEFAQELDRRLANPDSSQE